MGLFWDMANVLLNLFSLRHPSYPFHGLCREDDWLRLRCGKAKPRHSFLPPSVRVVKANGKEHGVKKAASGNAPA